MMRRLSEHLFAETDYRFANVGAAVTENGVVLIDAPVCPSDSQHWQKELRSFSPLGIRYLISTDFHGDHSTGSAFIKDVLFIAPQLVYDHIVEGKDPFSKKMFIETLESQGQTEEAARIAEAVIPLPKVCFQEGLILHFPPLTLDIRRLGGHTPACSVVYVPEEGVIFSGDVIIDSPTPGMREANLSQWLKALEWIESLPVETIVPGHGNICKKEVIGKLKGYLSGVRAAMEKLVQEGRTKQEAVTDHSFNKFFWADSSRGAYWVQSRKETFQRGLETLYDEVKGVR